MSSKKLRKSAIAKPRPLEWDVLRYDPHTRPRRRAEPHSTLSYYWRGDQERKATWFVDRSMYDEALDAECVVLLTQCEVRGYDLYFVMAAGMVDSVHVSRRAFFFCGPGMIATIGPVTSVHEARKIAEFRWRRERERSNT